MRARRCWPASPPSWCDAGVPQVLAMQAPVTDRYATTLGGEFYRRLATDASPDPLLALAGARRAAERDRQALPPGSPLRGPAEWATPALTTRALRLPLFNRREPFGPVRPPQAPVLAEGVVVREVGDFVGRRREMRQARRALGGDRRRAWCCTASAGWASPPWPRRCCGPWATTPGWWSPRPGRSRWTTCSARSGHALHQAASGG